MCVSEMVTEANMGSKNWGTEGKRGSKNGHGRKKRVQNMVAETKMDLKYGHRNKYGSQIWSWKQIWSRKQNEVSNMVTEISHSWICTPGFSTLTSKY